jgi:hypothetical protein
MEMGIMRECKKWDGCNAAICPLDPQWNAGQHDGEDQVCPIMLGLVKNGGEERLRVTYGDKVIDGVVAVMPSIISAVGSIAARVRRASLTGFRQDNLRKHA